MPENILLVLILSISYPILAVWVIYELCRPYIDWNAIALIVFLECLISIGVLGLLHATTPLSNTIIAFSAGISMAYMNSNVKER